MVIPLGKLVIIELTVDKLDDDGILFRTIHHPFDDILAQAFFAGTPLLVGQDEAFIEGGMMQIVAQEGISCRGRRDGEDNKLYGTNDGVMIA